MVTGPQARMLEVTSKPQIAKTMIVCQRGARGPKPQAASTWIWAECFFVVFFLQIPKSPSGFSSERIKFQFDGKTLAFSVEKTCRNLTKTEAPLNGGLVCHWYREENSQQCSVRSVNLAASLSWPICGKRCKNVFVFWNTLTRTTIHIKVSHRCSTFKMQSWIRLPNTGE